MASYLLRRSGIAVGMIAELIDWKADIIVQVGIGQHHEEIDVLREEWDVKEIIGFEPHPRIYNNLADYPGQVEPYAVSNERGEAILYSKQRHKDGSSLYPHHERDDEKYNNIKVDVTTLDYEFDYKLVPRLIPRILLWLDCEGNELKALQGGEEFIKLVDVVNVELTANPPGDGWCSPVDVHLWLAAHGFWEQWQHSNKSCGGQCDAMYVKSHLFDPKYCCIPHEVIRWREAQK